MWSLWINRIAHCIDISGRRRVLTRSLNANKFTFTLVYDSLTDRRISFHAVGHSECAHKGLSSLISVPFGFASRLLRWGRVWLSQKTLGSPNKIQLHQYTRRRGKSAHVRSAMNTHAYMWLHSPCRHTHTHTRGAYTHAYMFTDQANIVLRYHALIRIRFAFNASQKKTETQKPVNPNQWVQLLRLIGSARAWNAHWPSTINCQLFRLKFIQFTPNTLSFYISRE